jgi:hypothetical protein
MIFMTTMATTTNSRISSKSKRTILSFTSVGLLWLFLASLLLFFVGTTLGVAAQEQAQVEVVEGGSVLTGEIVSCSG